MRLALTLIGATLAACSAPVKQSPPLLSNSQTLQSDYQANVSVIGVQGLIAQEYARADLRNQCRQMVAHQNVELVTRRLGASVECTAG